MRLMYVPVCMRALGERACMHVRVYVCVRASYLFKWSWEKIGSDAHRKEFPDEWCVSSVDQASVIETA